MKNPKKPSSTLLNWRLLAQILILGLAAYVLAPQIVQLLNNKHLFTQLSVSWLILAETIYGLSFLFAALVYQALAGAKLSFWQTVSVQAATAFTNRLLPSGIGGIGTNTLYLTRRGYKKAAALSYVAANNLIGFVAFIIFIVVGGSVSIASFGQLFSGSARAVYGLLILTALSLIALCIRKVRLSIHNVASQIKKVSVALLRRPLGLAVALMASIGIPVCYTLSLYCCLRAAGLLLDVQQIVLVFGAGAVATSASPTPGGLGATEVAMLAAMSHFGVLNAPALACIVAFRLVSFWLPIVPGYVFFRICTTRKYI